MLYRCLETHCSLVSLLFIEPSGAGFYIRTSPRLSQNWRRGEEDEEEEEGIFVLSHFRGEGFDPADMHLARPLDGRLPSPRGTFTRAPMPVRHANNAKEPMTIIWKCLLCLLGTEWIGYCQGGQAKGRKTAKKKKFLRNKLDRPRVQSRNAFQNDLEDPSQLLILNQSISSRPARLA